MIKKQLKVIIICAAAIILLACAYLFWISPLINSEPKADAPELLEGEEYDTATGKILMFPVIEKENIADLAVHNEHGDFGFYQDTDSEFYITGYKGTPYNKSSFTTLISATRDPLATVRVTTDVSSLSEYGLDTSDNPSRYKITDKSGNSYTVYVGDAIPTGGGYYAMLEGRDAVYVLDNTLSSVKATPQSYVTPLLSMPTDTKDYYKTERFTLSKDGSPYISVEFMNETERTQTASTTYYKMLVPENYVPSSSNYEQILKTFNSFEGTETLKFGNTSDTMTKEELAEYRLDAPKYEIYYRYSGVDNYVMISDQNEDGSYYAYSLMFNIVARVSSSTLQFLSWDFIDFIDKPMFQKNINDIESITIKGADTEETFTFSGEDNSLSVTPKSTGKPFGEEEIKSFKQLYIKLLSLSLEDYAESTSKDEWIMTFTVKTRRGLEYEYSFYAYSTRRCYFTINGEGEFYVLRDRVQKILEDTKTLMSGGTITNEKS